MNKLSGYQTWTGCQEKRADGSVSWQIQVVGACEPFTAEQALEQVRADFPHAERIRSYGPVPRGDVLNDAPASEGWRRVSFVVENGGRQQGSVDAACGAAAEFQAEIDRVGARVISRWNQEGK